MNLSDLKTSKFLKKEDVGTGVLVTISSVTKENVAMEGADKDMKVAVHFEELEKPMILNQINGQVISNISSSSEDIENTWRGVKVVLYNDPNVSYSGRLVGGIRIRAPKPGAVIDSPLKMPESDNLPF